MRKAAAVEQKSTAPDTLTQSSPTTSQLLQQYGCGPIPFVGTENAFYERHLVLDRVIDPQVATARECFEVFSRSSREIFALFPNTMSRWHPISGRWNHAR
jgi:glycogen phosphorylase